ncbi:J domain-containing protein [Niallia oryzisoli]|uniref:J domain-containing protein n=1 Tax=Niallia oryzisoli TaxID=1737571 RepID=UPI003734D685
MSNEKIFIDYYMILGVPYNANHDQIKKAYRQLAKVRHPDVGGNEKDFMQIREAYDILINDSLRKNYNNLYRVHFMQIFSNEKQHESPLYREDVHEKEFSSTKTDHQKSANRKNQIWRPIYRVAGIILIILFIYGQIYNKQTTSKLDTDKESTEQTAEVESKTQQTEYKDTNTQEIMEENPIADQSDIPSDDNQNQTDDQTIKYTSEADSNNNVNPISYTGYFTLGSTKDEVKEVMGAPTSANENRWGYDFSSVQFENNIVVGWSDISNNLKVMVGERIESSTFTLGSSKDDLIKAMGTPTGISFDRWNYDFSSVTFKGDKIVGWSDISDNLRVFMSDPEPNSFFTIGSSKQDVLNAMGTPDGISYERWSYDFSSVQFNPNGFVEGYSDISNNLKVE